MNKRLILIIGAVLATIILLVVYANRATLNPFHLKSSSPVNGFTTVGTTDDLHFLFTKTPTSDTAHRFSISPAVQGQVTVNGNEILFTPTAGYAFGATYTATIKRPTATDGSVGSDVTIKFTTGVGNQLTPQQQKDTLKKTDSLQTTNPFLASLPYDSPDFHMEMQLLNSRTVLNVHLYGIITGAASEADILAKYQQQEAAAIAYIKSQGGDPTAYDITFDPSPLTGEGTYTQSATTAPTNNNDNED